MRRLPKDVTEFVPIDPRLLAEPGVRVGWFSGLRRVLGTTLSPAHFMGGDPLEGIPAKLVIDVKVNDATAAIIANVDVRLLFDAEDRPEA